MLRHVTSMVTLYDLKGGIVLQNVAAQTELELFNGERIGNLIVLLI